MSYLKLGMTGLSFNRHNTLSTLEYVGSGMAVRDDIQNGKTKEKEEKKNLIYFPI